METEHNYQETDLGNVSPNPRGEYDSKESYEYLDLVSYQGGSYLCLAEFGTTITGTAPEPGHNTEFWQMLTLPGDLTSEYVAMHDDVVNKATQVEISRAAVEQAQQEIEASQADVQQLHEDTVQAAQEAENSRDSAAGYAQSAEQSRKAASESEQNINAQMTGLNQKVSELVTQATGDIAAVRQQAIDTITTQEDTSTEAVEQVGNAALESARQALRDINTAGQRAVQTVTDQKNASVQAVKDETKDYIENKKKEIDDKTDEVTQAVNQAGKKQLEDIANSLDSTLTESGKAADSKTVGDALNTKITKFYASNQGETHIVDSDNGKIMDMIIYGRSEQAITNGYQLIDINIMDANGTKRELPYIENGVTVDVQSDGGISVKGTNNSSNTTNFHLTKTSSLEVKKGIYTASCKNATSDCYLVIGGETGNGGVLPYTVVNRSNVSYKMTAESDGNQGNLLIQMAAGATVDVVLYPMLEHGETMHDFEPYTGGAPSPNPDYPQEIKSVVKPVYKVHGRNLVKSYRNNKTNKPYASTLYVEIDEIMPDTQYVLSMIIADGNKAYINENLVKFTKVTGDGTRKQIVVTTLSNISKTDAKLYEKGKGWCILKNDESNTVVSDTKDVQLEIGTVATSYEPYKEQTVTLPYTLNAIPVDSDGNYTDADGQQWICDEIDLEREVYIQRVKNFHFTVDMFKWSESTKNNLFTYVREWENSIVQNANAMCEQLTYDTEYTKDNTFRTVLGGVRIRMDSAIDLDSAKKLLPDGVTALCALMTPIETELSTEEIQAFKQLTTYYPVTNISVNSDQLDGYTVFNYPVSMAEGWNYVKQQLSDNRDYIYDMDAKTQDIDTQSTEAYVNSEYAVALTELEAM